MFSSRIVAADFYLAKPIQKLDACYSDFRRCPTKRVPVVRIFGATPAGQKTCLHVHGVFPYLYVPYDGSLPVSKYLLEFANSIDKAIHVATGVKSTDQDTSNMAWQQVVFKIAIVNGMPMYGYYNEEKQFMKIYLYNPNLVGKVAELLLAGAIMNKVFQPHESHIPFILQFFIDYNLYGMNLIKLAVVKFRAPLNEDSIHYISPVGETPRTPMMSSSAVTGYSPYRSPGHRIWNNASIPANLMTSYEAERMSTCELEVDCVAADIINRLDLEATKGINPGIKAIWDDEIQRRKNKGESSQLTPPASQERCPTYEDSSEIEFKRIVAAAIKQFENEQSQQDANVSLDSDQLELSQIGSTPSCQIEIHSTSLNSNKEVNSIIEHTDSAINDNAVGETDVSYRRSEVSMDSELVDLLAHLGSSNDTNSLFSSSQLNDINSQDEVSIFSGSGRMEVDASKEDNELIKCDDDDEALLMSQIWTLDAFNNNDTVVNTGVQSIAVDSERSFSFVEENTLIEQVDGEDDSDKEVEKNTAKSLKLKSNRKTNECGNSMTRNVSGTTSDVIKSKRKYIVNDDQMETNLTNVKKKVARNLYNDFSVDEKARKTEEITVNQSNNSSEVIKHGTEMKVNFGSNSFYIYLNDMGINTDTLGYELKTANKIESNQEELVKNLSAAVTPFVQCNLNSENNLSNDIDHTLISENKLSVIEDTISHDKIGENRSFVDDSSDIETNTCDVLYKLSFLSPTYPMSPTETPPRPSTPDFGIDSLAVGGYVDVDRLNDMPLKSNENSASFVSVKVERQDDDASGNFDLRPGLDSTVTETSIELKPAKSSLPVAVSAITNEDKLQVVKLDVRPGFINDCESAQKEIDGGEISGRLLSMTKDCEDVTVAMEIPSKEDFDTQKNLQATIGHSSSSNPSDYENDAEEKGKMEKNVENFLVNYQQLKDVCDNSLKDQCNVLKYYYNPPQRHEISSTLSDYGLPHAKYQEPFYSNAEDLPNMSMEVGSMALKVKSCIIENLTEFDTGCSLSFMLGLNQWQSILFINHPKVDETLAHLASRSLPDISYEMHKNFIARDAILGDRNVIVIPSLEPPTRNSVEKWITDKSYGIKRKQSCIVDVDNLDSSVVGDGAKKQKSVQFDKICHQVGDFTQDPSMISAILNESTRESSSPASQLSASTKNLITDSEKFLIPSPCSKSSLSNSPKTGSITDNKPMVNIAGDAYVKGDFNCSPRTPLRKESIHDNNLKFKPKDRIFTATEMDSVQKFGRRLAADSQIEGPSPKNTYDFRISQHNPDTAKAVHEVQHLTIMSIELHIETRAKLNPDPECDPIRVLFYHLYRDIPRSSHLKNSFSGMIIVDPSLYDRESSVQADSKGSFDIKCNDSITLCEGFNSDDSLFTSPDEKKSNRSGRVMDVLNLSGRSRMLDKCGVTNAWVEYVPDEDSLLKSLGLVMKSWDPDILIGYEIQMLSWGYVFDRAKFLKIDLAPRLSRIPEQKIRSQIELTDNSLARYKTDLFVIGRILLNVWRIVRSEVTLNIYTFENVSYHVLHQRVPHYSFETLTEYFNQDSHRWKTIEYYLMRCRSNFLLLNELDTVGLTSEFARLFGIPFYSVLSRGSQFRVESMMLRIAKPMNYIAVSPSPDQRAMMRAPEVISLILEPESRFYSDPVVVLDFQSLYPSIIIAYNYCFSTCLGNVKNIITDESRQFGCTTLRVPLATMKKIKEDYTVSPTGLAFVKSNIRKGVLPRMLEEILNTRVMVKGAMKKNKGDKALERLLNARQLGLKLISNVTYGYTSANFSGRMPCVEIGDSIVAKARETLTRAIHLVENTPEWKAKVVYGDTDSMFILLEGATKDEAFRIGREITKRVTELNPVPVKLKFEKVYLPCVLQTKKRYVGFAYEKEDQFEPIYDAKGIETVRRDGCPAVAKILEKSIKMLFMQRDVSLIKKFVLRQCQKLIDGKASTKDFVIAKEYRGRSSYKPGACVPSLEISKKLLATDKRAEPRVGERVPYVVVYGMPGLPLIRLVRRPIEFLSDPSLRLNAAYYITKQILPPLNRIFSLIGVDTNAWYNELPRSLRSAAFVPQSNDLIQKATISQYFNSLRCPICEIVTNHGICCKCQSDPQKAILLIQDRLRLMERAHCKMKELCYQCIGVRLCDVQCESLDCPILFKVLKAKHELVQASHLRKVIEVFSSRS